MMIIMIVVINTTTTTTMTAMAVIDMLIMTMVMPEQEPSWRVLPGGRPFAGERSAAIRYR